MELHKIHSNVLGQKKIGKYPIRNICEGAVYAIIIVFIIKRIPFVPRVSTIFSVSCALGAFILGTIGIRDRSISQFIIDYLTFKKSKKIYHLESVNSYENKQIIREEQINSSKVQQWILKIKNWYTGLDEEE